MASDGELVKMEYSSRLMASDGELVKIEYSSRLRLPYSLKWVKLLKLSFPWNKIGRKKSFKAKQNKFFFDISNISQDILSPEVEFWWAFSVSPNAFFSKQLSPRITAT